MTALALHKALITRLATDLAIAVVDEPPAAERLPLVVIESHTITFADTLAERYIIDRVSIGLYSSHQGQKELLEMIGQITNSLHRGRLTLDAGTVLLQTIENLTTEPATDAPFRAGGLTLRVHFQEG